MISESQTQRSHTPAPFITYTLNILDSDLVFFYEIKPFDVPVMKKGTKQGIPLRSLNKTHIPYMKLNVFQDPKTLTYTFTAESTLLAFEFNTVPLGQHYLPADC
jgi:hypothetical protein